MTKTAVEWWNGVVTSPERLVDWLKRQHHSELSSVPRLRDLREDAEDSGHPFEDLAMIDMIINDELRHAAMVAELLEARSCEAALLEGHKSRYFKESMQGAVSGEPRDVAAVAAFAEFTSLDRFRAILADPRTPEDIRKTIEAISWDEELHYVAFRRIAGRAAFEKVRISHENALAALGIASTPR